MLRVTFLGTSSARPTVERNVSSIAIHREGDLHLFDCGEGTQRQMMRYGVGFTVRDIYLTHLHADHYLGVFGLLRTMGLQGRTEPIRVWTPPQGRPIILGAVRLEIEQLPFQLEIADLAPGEEVRHEGYVVRAFRAEHPGGANGYALIEDARLGRFHPERARALGVPEGPLFGQLHRGEPVRLPGGKEVSAQEVVGPPRRGRRVVYSGDTRPCESTVEIAREADLLIHEATFSEEEVERAEKTGHSTAAQAAAVAARAGVQRLALTHLSARYSDRPGVLEREARGAWAGSSIVVAYDGLEIEIPHADG